MVSKSLCQNNHLSVNNNIMHDDSLLPNCNIVKLNRASVDYGSMPACRLCACMCGY